MLDDDVSHHLEGARAEPLRLAGSKVAAVFMTRNAVVRRSATVLPDDRVRDEEVARSAFEKLGHRRDARRRA
jgi:hypothetical protein